MVGSPTHDSHDVAAQALLALQGVLTEPGRRGGNHSREYALTEDCQLFLYAQSLTMAARTT